MIRFSGFGLCAAMLLAAVSAMAATPWMGGRGPGNTGAYADIPFPVTPAVVWKSSPGSAYVGVAPSNALVAGDLVICAYGTKLLAVSAETGEVRWQQNIPAVPVGELLLLDEQIIVTIPEGIVFAYNPVDGTQLWKRTLFASVSNMPFVSDDALLFATKSNTMEVVARKTGTLLTSIDLRSTIDASPLVYGKSILLCFTQGTLSLVEGNINRWSTTLRNVTITRNPIKSGDLILVNAEKVLFALNTISPTSPIRWNYSRPDMLPESVTVDGNRIFLITTAGRLLAVDGETGKNLWGKDGLALPYEATGAPLIIGDYLVVRMKYGVLATFTKDTGELVWQYRLPVTAGLTGEMQLGAPVVRENDLFFGASDGNLYRLSAAMPDIDPPTFRQVLPTMAGTDFAPDPSLQYVGAMIEDEGSGLVPDSVTIKLDQIDLTPQIQRHLPSSYYYVRVSQLTLQPGVHRLTISATDQRGNVGTHISTFYVGNNATTERLPVAIRGAFTPRIIKVRPGTIIEWINDAGSPRTVLADNMIFTSDTQYPQGIAADERWAWVVPANLPAGTVIHYHCRIYGEKGDGKSAGPGLSGTIEVVDPRRDVPGVPKVMPGMLATFPVPGFVK